MDPPPQPFYSFLSPRGVRRAIVNRHVEPFAEVSHNLCGELRAEVATQRQGYPESQQQFENFLSTISAVLLGSGQANRNLLALSTITRRCRFAASDIIPMSWISISRTSRGLRKRAGSMATYWLVDRLSLRHPQEST